MDSPAPPDSDALAAPTSPTPVPVDEAGTRRDDASLPLTETGWASRLEEMDAAELRSLVVTLPTIEQAKGVLMGFYRCDATAAFALLRRWSSSRHVKLRDLGAELVEHAGRETARPEPSRHADPPGPVEGATPFESLQAYLEAGGLRAVQPASSSTDQRPEPSQDPGPQADR